MGSIQENLLFISSKSGGWAVRRFCDRHSPISPMAPTTVTFPLTPKISCKLLNYLLKLGVGCRVWGVKILTIGNLDE